MQERIAALGKLKTGWDGAFAKRINLKTRNLATDLVVDCVLDDSWEVGPYPDGSIVFTNKRQTKKIMVAAI